MSKLDRLFEDYKARIISGSENGLFAVPEDRGGFSVYPPAPDYPGFRICGLLDEDGVSAVCEALAGREDIDAIRERLECEEASAYCVIAQDWIGDNEESIPEDILADAEKADEIADETRKADALKTILNQLPDDLYDDFRERRDQRIAEEGIFCLDAGLRDGELKGKISFAPYYDFNIPLFEEKAGGEKECRKIMEREFPAIAPDDDDRPSFRM